MDACSRAQTTQLEAPDLLGPRIPRAAGWSDVLRHGPHGFLTALSEAADAIERKNPDLQGLLVPAFDVGPAHDVDPTAASVLAYDVAMTLDAATDEVATRCSVFEGLVDLEAHGRLSGVHSTPSDVALLVARLLDFSGGTILDPAVGSGALLQHAASLQERAADDQSLLGLDINQDAWRRARSRFYLYGFEADIRNENALTAAPDSLPQADAVVADPPYGLENWGYAELYVDPWWRFGAVPPRSADYAWLQLASLHLKPAGRAAVLLGTGSLWRSGREGAIRAHMLEAGVVEAIIVLPPRLQPNTSIPLAVWLLRSPDTRIRSQHVLLVDASDLGAPGRSRFSLPLSSVDRIVDLVSAWRNTGEVADGDHELAVAADLDDIFAAEGNLNPGRYRSQPTVDLTKVETTARALRRSLRQSSAAAAQAREDLLTYLEKRR
jgi:type I restriction enzyme M protein